MRKKLNKLLLITSLLLFPIAVITPLVGCKTSQQVLVYKTLATVQVSVDAARKAYVAMAANKLVTPEMTVKVLAANNKFHAAFIAAVAAAGTLNAPSPENVSLAASEFVTLIYSFINK